ncbi:MAG: Unknown protein [uncultured Sulfurovum sp.]|uniref:HNH domain-containing protein n=1 Tax=uncultured Sulfurovum sp. TaxID=269237 RepID=A0A6S6SHK0_9BACT|nr:MAG: Unknown protein [uncultured Sulfurovum sp.]
MIDMRGFFRHRAYPCVVDKFKTSFDRTKLNCDDYWFVFTDLQKRISNDKCPICEVKLTDKPNRTNTATLDHFRPKSKEMYPHLKCIPENYILMCSLCNTTYKEDIFPLFDESKRATEAKIIKDTKHEQPLLFNPTEIDPLHFFELAFRQTQQGGTLELKRNNKTIPKDKDSYEYQQCHKMITMFGLGYCHKDNRTDTRKERNLETGKMETIVVQECRIDILTKHYGTFIELAKARSNKKSLALFFKDKNRKNELKKYGFFRFIMKNQFTIK